MVWLPFGLLGHKKILTRENMAKIGILCYHQCLLCCKALETINHLFLECKFSLQVWTLLLRYLHIVAPNDTIFPQLFTSLKSRYPSPMRDKPMWKQFWLELPKYICSKIWLSRNRAIFSNNFPARIQVIEQPKGLLLETLKDS